VQRVIGRQYLYPGMMQAAKGLPNRNRCRMEPLVAVAMLRHARRSLQTEVTMLVTLVAILCNGPLCLEKVVTNSEQSGITMTACQVNAQSGIAEWLANGPYHEWKLEGYKCVLGTYTPKRDA
jgi:hypothetical protein